MNEQEIRDNILSIIMDQIQYNDFELSDSLVNISVDDFDFIEILIQIEHDYEKTIDDSNVFVEDFNTINEFIDWVVKQII